MRGALTASRSETELLPDEPVHLAAVGAPLGLAHHEADDRAHGLLLAALQLLDRACVRLERPIYDALELVGARQPERALLDDRRWIAALRGEHVEDLLGRCLRDRLRVDEGDELGDGGGLAPGPRRVGPAEPRDHLVG